MTCSSSKKKSSRTSGRLGVRLQGEEDPRLPQELPPSRSRRRGSNLQSHQPVVLAIEGAQHAPFASRTDHLEGLVTVAEELRHSGSRSRPEVA